MNQRLSPWLWSWVVVVAFGVQSYGQELLLSWTGENSGDLFGCHLGSIADLNGDGYRDVLVSAPSLQ